MNASHLSCVKTKLRSLVRLHFALPALGLSLAIAPVEAASFTSTGSLSAARAGHAATLLPNGNVLVVGGYNGTDRLASSELYSPATGAWNATGSLTTRRTGQTFLTLLSNGLVLAAGGGVGGRGTASCELYDPASGTWTNTGSLVSARVRHTATLLLNGKVLITGGSPDVSISSLSSAELYDPATGTWTTTGSMTTVRQYHTATLLPDGRVLVAGGDNTFDIFSSAELYDPATQTWTVTGALRHARTLHTATLLPGGNVLAVGGQDSDSTSTATSELYDAVTGTWTATGSLKTARFFATATLLPNGEVLVTAGFSFNPDTWFSSAELYDSAAGPIALANPAKQPSGAFQFAFTGAANGTNTVLTTTDPAVSVANWTVLGRVPEFAPGLYLFSDPQVANNAGRFYSVRSP